MVSVRPLRLVPDDPRNEVVEKRRLKVVLTAETPLLMGAPLRVGGGRNGVRGRLVSSEDFSISTVGL